MNLKCPFKFGGEILEQGAPPFKPPRYVLLKALLPFLLSKSGFQAEELWGWQEKGDFLQQEQKTPDCSLAMSRLPPSRRLSGGGEVGGG